MTPRLIHLAKNETTGQWYKVYEYYESDETPFYNVFPDSYTQEYVNTLPYSGYYNLQSLLNLKGLVLYAL